MTHNHCGPKPQNHRKPPQKETQTIEILESSLNLEAEPIELEAEELGPDGEFVRRRNKVIRTGGFVRNVGQFLGGMSVQTGIGLLQLSRFVLQVAFWVVLIVHGVLKTVVPVVLPWLIGLSVLGVIAYGLATVIKWVLSQNVFWTGLAVVAGLAYLVWMAGLFLSVRRRKSRGAESESGPATGPGTVVNIFHQVSVSGKTIVNIFTQIIKND